MKIEGSGQAVSRVNDPQFTGFTTKSGRTLEDDLARAAIKSPIRLADPAPRKPGKMPQTMRSKTAVRAALERPRLPPVTVRPPMPPASAQPRKRAVPARASGKRGKDAAPRRLRTGQTRQEQYQRIIPLHREGLSAPQIGRALGYSGDVVRARLAELGVKPHRGRLKNTGTPTGIWRVHRAGPLAMFVRAQPGRDPVQLRRRKPSPTSGPGRKVTPTPEPPAAPPDSSTDLRAERKRA